VELSTWLSDMRLLLEKFKKKDIGYPHQSNDISPPGKEALFKKLLAKTGFDESSQVARFYKSCDGFSLPDVWNGYFIHSTKLTLKFLETGPFEVTGPLAGKIIVLGSDGGGGLFAIRRDGPGEMLHLHEDGVTGAPIFDGSFNPAKVISVDFFGFLVRVQADLEAYIDDREGWHYMI